MSFTYHGIGTRLYGERDFLPDGSFITTKWFVVAYLPIVPLKSMRIAPTGKTSYYGLNTSRSYVLIKKVRLNLGQVLSVYAWFAVLVSGIWAIEKWKFWWIAIPVIPVLCTPWFLKSRARKRMMEESRRKAMGMSETTIG